MTNNLQDRFRERFAELEHIRWAKWQNYLHSFLAWNNELHAWVLPHEKKAHWQRQIETTYSMLSEKEKESDREQVKPYLQVLSSEVEQAEKDLINQLLSEAPEEWDMRGAQGVESASHINGFNQSNNQWRTLLESKLK